MIRDWQRTVKMVKPKFGEWKNANEDNDEVLMSNVVAMALRRCEKHLDRRQAVTAIRVIRGIRG
jgi:hypothetical protein